MVDRGRYLTLRASTDELSMVKALAERDGLNVSDVVRLLIRRAYAERFGTEEPPKRRTKKR